jgi:hypothetical protein
MNGDGVPEAAPSSVKPYRFNCMPSAIMLDLIHRHSLAVPSEGRNTCSSHFIRR